MSENIIIIGGGQAAAMAAAALRQNGFQGTLTLISNESELPYERPPLSKAALLEENPSLQPVLPDAWWQENQVKVILNGAVSALDRRQRRVLLGDGAPLPYDKLLLATGARARPLAQLDALGDAVFTLRHADDASRLRRALMPGSRIIIVGAGTIGLELAASTVQRECRVSVVEMAPVIMGRNAPAPIQTWLLEQHRRHGVTFHFNSHIEQISRQNGMIEAVLQNGERLNGDIVIYGIGIEANDRLAQAAGLETANGIVVDERCRTADEAIFAAGDVVRVRLPDGSLTRRETWENANQQAQLAAAAMLDLPLPAATPGWFWTDQYDANLQFIGEMQGGNWLQRGDAEAGKAIWFNLRDGLLIGAVTLNQGREMRQLRKLIQSGCRPDVRALVDEGVALKAL